MTQEEPQSTEDPSLKGEITNMSDADKRILMFNLTNNRLFRLHVFTTHSSHSSLQRNN